MPRQREVTMGKVTGHQAHEAAIKLVLKKHKPYKLIAKHSFGMTKKRRWMIIYQAGDLPKPVVIKDDIKIVGKGRRLIKLLERAWAEGSYAARMG
jgi:hypothetical protein